MSKTFVACLTLSTSWVELLSKKTILMLILQKRVIAEKSAFHNMSNFTLIEWYSDIDNAGRTYGRVTIIDALMEDHFRPEANQRAKPML